MYNTSKVKEQIPSLPTVLTAAKTRQLNYACEI